VNGSPYIVMDYISGQSLKAGEAANSCVCPKRIFYELLHS